MFPVATRFERHSRPPVQASRLQHKAHRSMPGYKETNLFSTSENVFSSLLVSQFTDKLPNLEVTSLCDEKSEDIHYEI